MSDITTIQQYVNIMFQCECGQVLLLSETKNVVWCQGCDKVYTYSLNITEDEGIEE